MSPPVSTKSKSFKVIVVGGGIVGLSLSHALQLANIDHVVLEKHDKIISVRGAAVIIWPNAARILDQFGVLEKIHQTSTPLMNDYRRWPDGSVNSSPKGATKIAKAFDTRSVLIDREQYVTHLYDSLPDKSKIYTSKRVDRIDHTDSGVRVFLSDGTVEEGDIVIGADGVHSAIRDQMWSYANNAEPNAIPESDKSAMFSEFGGYFGVSKMKDSFGLSPSESNITFGHDHSKLLFTQPGIVYWCVVFKDVLSRPPRRRKGGQEDIEAVTKRYANTAFTEKLKLSDLLETRTEKCGLLNFEEGVLSRWHAGRIVLVGDSAHKMTADLGVGASMGLESAVRLCNILHRELKSDRTRHPSMSELSTMFAEYQEESFQRSKAFVELSGKVTRMHTYQTLFARFFVGYVSPYLNNIRVQKFAEAFGKSPKLDYAPVRTMNESADGWKLAEKKDEENKGAGWLTYVVLTSTIGVTVAYMARQGLFTLF